MNSDSGMLNTVSGKEGEVFRLNRNERSHWSGNGVHVESELVFMIGRNMHGYSRQQFYEIRRNYQTLWG